MIYNAFDRQSEFHNSNARIRGVFCGKRSGKSECGAIEAIIHTENQVGHISNDIDPYLGVIIAPTNDMLRRLSLAKFMAYAKSFQFEFHKTFQEFRWHNGSVIYCISGEKPQRLEGLKANWIWMDEIFQMSEQLFWEAIARTSDTKGRLWVTGSLGVQYTNPRQHFVYKYLKENPLEDTECFEWGTEENPYFPKDELQRLKATLDPKTFRQMFQIDWDIPSNAAVYPDFDETNAIRGYVYNPNLETYVSIDWGYAHPMACLFFQYDKEKDIVYLFDEIVSSRMTLDQMWERIIVKDYKITEWICDIAGNQEREATGWSNVKWFRETHQISFKYRATAINHGIPIVRSYIKNGIGQRKFFIDEIKCPKSIDGIKNYRYPEKNGTIQNENPVKKDDDTNDATRYFFVNRLDRDILKPSMTQFNRFGTWRP